MNLGDPTPEPWAIFERSSPGWFRVTVSDDEDAAELFVGGVLGDDGRPVITGLALLGHNLNGNDLRHIPLGRIQAALASPRRRDWIAVAPPGLHPLRDLQEVADEGPDYVYRHDARRARLTRPDGSNTESFYRLVSEAYTHYAMHSTKPAMEIATEAGVPAATARRWINRARELGLLEKGGRRPRK